MQRNILFLSSKMLKKRSPDRKKKRIVKKILVISCIAIGVVGLLSTGVYFLIMHKLQQPNYISPLASIGFVQARQKDSKVELVKKELKKHNIEYTSVQQEKDAVLTVKLKDGGIVTFSSQKDIMTQIASLQYILSHLTMEGKLFTRLDFRFEKPVIVLK